MLDELKIRYKELPLLKRLALGLLVGLLPAALIYLDESSVIDESYTVAEQGEKVAAAQLLEADKTIKNLAKAEADLTFTREQLKKAEGRLPDSIAVDEVLRTIGKSAKDTNVQVTFFEPLPEVLRGDDYKYSEFPMKITAEASQYAQLCEWLDSLAGLKSKIYLKAWKLERKAGKGEEQAMTSTQTVGGMTAIDQNALPEILAKQSRERMVLVVSADLSMFKLPSAAQLANPPTPTPAGQKTPPNPKKASIDSQPGDAERADVLPRLDEKSFIASKGGAP